MTCDATHLAQAAHDAEWAKRLAGVEAERDRLRAACHRIDKRDTWSWETGLRWAQSIARNALKERGA